MRRSRDRAALQWPGVALGIQTTTLCPPCSLSSRRSWRRDRRVGLTPDGTAIRRNHLIAARSAHYCAAHLLPPLLGLESLTQSDPLFWILPMCSRLYISLSGERDKTPGVYKGKFVTNRCIYTKGSASFHSTTNYVRCLGGTLSRVQPGLWRQV